MIAPQILLGTIFRTLAFPTSSNMRKVKFIQANMVRSRGPNNMVPVQEWIIAKENISLSMFSLVILGITDNIFLPPFKEKLEKRKYATPMRLDLLAQLYV